MQRYFDIKNNRLVYVGVKANDIYWDSHWKNMETGRHYGKKNYILPLVKKYITSGCILEGGCGRGQHVLALHNAGYDAKGIDYAGDTVERIKSYYPQLDVRLGDVRSLPFGDNYFDAYVSLGVIEHFYEGYIEIINEMKRVVKKDGYLFVTFPVMSVLRKIKAKLKKYPEWEVQKEGIENFYQFALDKNRVINDLNEIGFKCIRERSFDGIKGVIDEIEILKPFLQKMSNSKKKYIRVIRFVLGKALAFFGGHLCVLVFIKK